MIHYYTPLKEELFKDTMNSKKKEKLVIVFFGIIYLVGFFGSIIPAYRTLFLSLTPLILILSFCAILCTLSRPIKPTLTFLLFSGLVGFIAELIGVNTKLLFGNYHYESNLGVKIAGVPVIIAINWAIVTIGAAHCSALLSANKLARMIIAAFLMLLFDFILEPVAIKSGFWNWEGGLIPAYNYICWFFIGLFLQIIYFSKIKHDSNKVIIALFLLMTVFFICLNLF
jgi:bisanhydrobacterioruberin hydratase